MAVVGGVLVKTDGDRKHKEPLGHNGHQGGGSGGSPQGVSIADSEHAAETGHRREVWRERLESIKKAGVPSPWNQTQLVL